MYPQKRDAAKLIIWKIIHNANQKSEPETVSKLSEEIKTDHGTIRITVLLGGAFFRMFIDNMVFIGRNRIDQAVDHLAEIL